MRYLLFICFNLLLVPSLSFAEDNAGSLGLKKMVVVGTVPGPDLWKVTNGENVLWILGTLSPLPKKMKWNSKPVEELIESSQAFMLAPSFFASLKGIGFFKKLSLAKSAIGIKKSPEKEKLVDILPEDVYTRWLVLKKKYMGNSKRIEKNRPIFASNKLFSKALKKTGLTEKTGITKKLVKVAKKNELQIIRPRIEIDLADPKATIKKFKKTELNDIECFTKTLDRIESDLATMSTRAVAWSYGDVKTIKSLPYTSNKGACDSAFFNSAVGQDLGLAESHARLNQVWVEHATSSLEKNKSTFAVIPISYLLNEDGILRELASAGYEVQPPISLIENEISEKM